MSIDKKLAKKTVNYIVEALKDESNHAALVCVVRKDGNILIMPAADSPQGLEHLVDFLPNLPEEVLKRINNQEPTIESKKAHTVH